MSGSVFVDTNVFVYSIDQDQPEKRRRAQEVLAASPGLTVSTQVLNEFYVVATRKLARPLAVDDAAEMIEAMASLNCVPVDAGLVRTAVHLGRRWQLSHWDALLVAAAHQGNCQVILTEDLSDGASYENIRIENPFRGR